MRSPGPAGRPAAHLRSVAGRGLPEAGSHAKDDQRGKQDERQNHCECILTCGLEPEVGFEPTTFRLRVETPSSSLYQPGPFWLLTSAGSSIQCVPDLASYGRANDQENDQAVSRKPHRTTATFLSGSEGRSSTGELACRRCRLMVGQQLPTEIGWQGEHRGRGLTLNAFVATLSASANRQWTEGHDPGRSSWEKPVVACPYSTPAHTGARHVDRILPGALEPTPHDASQHHRSGA